MPRRPAMMQEIGFDNPTVIKLIAVPSASQANFLHVLGEFPNRIAPVDYLCQRLHTSPLGLRILASRLRKCLNDNDWTIQCTKGGYRLIDLRDK